MGKRNTGVYVETQAEWDKVIRTIRPTDYYNSFSNYSESCIDVDNGSHCSRDWFKRNDYCVITYSEWLSDNSEVPISTHAKPLLIQVPKI